MNGRVRKTLALVGCCARGEILARVAPQRIATNLFHLLLGRGGDGGRAPPPPPPRWRYLHRKCGVRIGQAAWLIWRVMAASGDLVAQNSGVWLGDGGAKLSVGDGALAG